MLNFKHLLNTVKHNHRSKLVKQATLYKYALTKLALRYAKNHNFIKYADPRDFVVEHGGMPNTNVLTTPVNGYSSDGTSALRTHNGALNREDADRLQKTKEHTQAMDRKLPFKHLDPGVYVINTGVFPLPGFKAMGVSDALRHSVAATIHDEQPDIPDAYQMPNGQWVTYFTSNPTSKYPWIGGENLPVWNGHYNAGGKWNTKKDWHKANEHIFNSMVNPNYQVDVGPVAFNPGEFKIDYTRVADGEEEALRVAKIWQKLYECNKDRSFGPYSYGLAIPANNCLNATAFALANANIPQNRYPSQLGGGGSIPKENINKYINLGITPYNQVPVNPAPPSLVDGIWPNRKEFRASSENTEVPVSTVIK